MNIKAKWQEVQKSEEYIAIDKLLKQRSAKIFLSAIAFRIGMLLLSIVIMTMFGSFEAGLTWNDFLESFKRWDANGYMSIAENGYSAWFENGMYVCIVFFPLYPWLVKALALIVGQYTLAGLVASTLCFAVACVFVDKLVQIDYSEETADHTIIGLAVYPFAFFFGTIMTESLFVMIIAMFFYFLRKHKWIAVMLMGFLACLTKVQGVLLALPIFVEILYHNIYLRKKEGKRIYFWRDVIVTGMYCVPMFSGTLVYLYINYAVTGNAFTFLKYQRENWNNQMLDIFSTIRYVSNYATSGWFTSTGMSMWVPEMILFIVFLAAIIYGFVKKLRPMYKAFLVIWFIITYSSSWLISGGRYSVSALPLFLLEGMLITEHPKWKMPILGGSAMLMVIYYFGYLIGRQIL